ncbi:MAG: hypothetical protein H0V30_10815 [Chitinophagaceae bacterium]|jgi:hypothetical protein|nr:hypothetical protein [Chitinophagaceae bacterium]
MVRLLPRILLLSSIFFLYQYSASGQDLSGIWRGYFITESGDNYKLEFQIVQNKSLTVTGVSYSYLDVRFYGKANMTGRYIKSEKQFQIQENRTVEVKSTTGGGTCIMNYNLSYVKSGPEEFLEGNYLGKSENRMNPRLNGQWGDCGGGKVFLRRVHNSDFYVEPFLRDQPRKSTPKTTPKESEKKPESKKETPKTTIPPESEVLDKKPEEKKIEFPESKPKEKEITPAPPILKTRSNELTRTFEVNTKKVIIRLYDNGEIDDDTVSVYFNNKLVLDRKRLSTVPLTITLNLEDENEENELIMVAENLGRIPPNTSLMIVQAGDQRFQVNITSTDQKNALVRFIYRKP